MPTDLDPNPQIHFGGSLPLRQLCVSIVVVDLPAKDVSGLGRQLSPQAENLVRYDEDPNRLAKKHARDDSISFLE
jgi:hypothetical protein